MSNFLKISNLTQISGKASFGKLASTVILVGALSTAVQAKTQIPKIRLATVEKIEKLAINNPQSTVDAYDAFGKCPKFTPCIYTFPPSIRNDIQMVQYPKGTKIIKHICELQKQGAVVYVADNVQRIKERFEQIIPNCDRSIIANGSQILPTILLGVATRGLKFKGIKPSNKTHSSLGGLKGNKNNKKPEKKRNQACYKAGTQIEKVTKILKRRGAKIKSTISKTQKCTKSKIQLGLKAKQCHNILGVKTNDSPKSKSPCKVFTQTPLVYEHIVGFNTSASACGITIPRKQSPIRNTNPSILLPKYKEAYKDRKVANQCQGQKKEKGLRCLIDTGTNAYKNILIQKEKKRINQELINTFGNPLSCKRTYNINKK